jgi:hypothetical protein
MSIYEGKHRARPAQDGKKWEVVKVGPYPGREVLETVFSGSEEEATALAASLNGPVATPAQQAQAEANTAAPAASEQTGAQAPTESQSTAEVTATEVQGEPAAAAEPVEGVGTKRRRS